MVQTVGHSIVKLRPGLEAAGTLARQSAVNKKHTVQNVLRRTLRAVPSSPHGMTASQSAAKARVPIPRRSLTRLVIRLCLGSCRRITVKSMASSDHADRTAGEPRGSVSQKPHARRFACSLFSEPPLATTCCGGGRDRGCEQACSGHQVDSGQG